MSQRGPSGYEQYLDGALRLDQRDLPKFKDDVWKPNSHHQQAHPGIEPIRSQPDKSYNKLWCVGTPLFPECPQRMALHQELGAGSAGYPAALPFTLRTQP